MTYNPPLTDKDLIIVGRAFCRALYDQFEDGTGAERLEQVFGHLSNHIKPTDINISYVREMLTEVLDQVESERIYGEKIERVKEIVKYCFPTVQKQKGETMRYSSPKVKHWWNEAYIKEEQNDDYGVIKVRPQIHFYQDGTAKAEISSYVGCSQYEHFTFHIDADWFNDNWKELVDNFCNQERERLEATKKQKIKDDAQSEIARQLKILENT